MTYKITYLSNFLIYPKVLINKFHEDNYIEWDQKKIQSLTYTFKSEIEPIMDSKMIIQYQKINILNY